MLEFTKWVNEMTKEEFIGLIVLAIISARWILSSIDLDITIKKQ